MFNATSIQSSFRGLVGVRPSDNSDIIPIASTSDLLDSSSGLYINDISGITSDILQANNNADFADYQTYLLSTYDSTVLNTLTDFWNQKKGLYKTKEVLENRVLIQDAVCFNDTQITTDFVHGFKIKPFMGNNIKLEISKVSALFNVSATFDIYIYSTHKKVALLKKSITIVDGVSTSIDVTLSEIYSQNNGIGGEELLLIVYGYNNSAPKLGELPLNALSYSVPFTNEAKYVRVEPVTFGSSAFNWNNTTNTYDLPDMTKISYTCHNGGLNFRMLVKCDMTQLIIDNKLLFAKVIQLAWAIKLLWDAVGAYDFNAVTESKREHWRNLAIKYEMELKGYSDENKAQVQGYFEKIDLDLSNLDKICLPCQDRGVQVVRQRY